MRKILFAILLAGTAATQANAAPADQPAQQAKNAKPKPAKQVRAKSAEPKRTQPSVAVHRVPNTQAGQANSGAQAARPNTQPKVQVQRTQQQRPTVQPSVQNRPVTQPANRVPNVQRARPPAVSTVPHIGTQPPPRAQSRPTLQPQWSTNWRNNQRYDWGNYRGQHRSVFHLQSYRDPFGWGYQAFAIGWRLWPNYYSSSYWINDPWMYRLPPAPPGTRWIRYYNDALLVDMWSGEVVDVIHGFFW